MKTLSLYSVLLFGALSFQFSSNKYPINQDEYVEFEYYDEKDTNDIIRLFITRDSVNLIINKLSSVKTTNINILKSNWYSLYNPDSIIYLKDETKYNTLYYYRNKYYLMNEEVIPLHNNTNGLHNLKEIEIADGIVYIFPKTSVGRFGDGTHFFKTAQRKFIKLEDK